MNELLTFFLILSVVLFLIKGLCRMTQLESDQWVTQDYTRSLAVAFFLGDLLMFLLSVVLLVWHVRRDW